MNPDLRLPSIDGLRAFEATARLGSFERAAGELAITASAVSKRITTVEELLGTPLFQRTPKLTLTAAGKEYLEHVRAALGLLAAVPLHRRSTQRLQRLRVRTPPTFARQILVPQLPSFTSAHPEIELEVVLSIPFLDSGDSASDADVVVRHGEVAPAAALMQDIVLPVAAPSLLAKLPPIAAPAALAQAPLLRAPLEPWTPWFRAAGLDWPEPASGTRLVDLGMTLEAAVAGQGVALARPTLAGHWLDSGALVPLFGGRITARPARQYYLEPHAESGAAALFAHWLRETCERTARLALERLSGPR